MSSKVVVFIFIAISGVFSSAKIDYTPIVLWHGMGEQILRLSIHGQERRRSE